MLYYPEEKQKSWVRFGRPKGISSIASLIEGFLEHWGPGFRWYENTFQDLVVDVQEEEAPTSLEDDNNITEKDPPNSQD